MKQSLYVGKEPNFQKIIIASAVLHLLFITLIVIPIKRKERDYKTYYVNLVAPAQIRKAERAPSASGKGTKKAAKTVVKKKAPPRRRVKAKKGVSLKPVNKEAVVAKEIERLRAIKSLSRQKKEKEQQMAKAREDDEAITGAIDSIRKKIHGRVSIGSPSAGRTSSVDSESYYALVIQRIQNEWIHPEYDSSLEVIISIRMDKDGNVTDYKIEESSGNKRFDLTAVHAIKKASPLPPHPVEREIEMRFRYEKDMWF